MRLFSLSLRNVRKSFRDYAVYFLTLILGVAIFYVFSALDSQQAMLRISQNTRDILKLMVAMLSGVSVLVACILGFLIVYANRFLIRRRKKEFAIYMTLGMGRRHISRLLVGETLVIGLASLSLGLLIGVFASQFMSRLVSRMFEADMSAYTFTFSSGAALKTVLYFGVMFLVVILFNALSVSRCRLIDLLQASRRTEVRRLRSSLLAVLVFLAACLILGRCYYRVTVGALQLDRSGSLRVIFLGCLGTYLLFWSMAGFLLNLLRAWKGFYLRGLNSFILRQVNSSIQTFVLSMTLVCLLFFVTVEMLSTGFAMNNSLRGELRTNCPRDISLYMDLSSAGEKEGLYALTVPEALAQAGFDTSLLAQWVEIPVYTCPELTLRSSLGGLWEQAVSKGPASLLWDIPQEIVSLSDYNRLAAFYGQPVYETDPDQYLVLCTHEGTCSIRNLALQAGVPLRLGESLLTPARDTCQPGLLMMSNSSSNTGFFVLPDQVIQKELGRSLSRAGSYLAADYTGTAPEEKQAVEDQILSLEESRLPVPIDGMTKITLYESSVGLSAIVTFVAIYLGVVFFIAGAALLALRELSESADNRERFRILDKIGADKRMQHRALLAQMGIFFAMPLALALVHSIFGIQYAYKIMSFYQAKDILASLCITAVTLTVIYTAYFAATYLGSRRIIDGE